MPGAAPIQNAATISIADTLKLLVVPVAPASLNQHHPRRGSIRRIVADRNDEAEQVRSVLG
jgi:hypothetical protein